MTDIAELERNLIRAVAGAADESLGSAAQGHGGGTGTHWESPGTRVSDA
jgi:hypothetical protein